MSWLLDFNNQLHTGVPGKAARDSPPTAEVPVPESRRDLLDLGLSSPGDHSHLREKRWVEDTFLLFCFSNK